MLALGRACIKREVLGGRIGTKQRGIPPSSGLAHLIQGARVRPVEATERWGLWKVSIEKNVFSHRNEKSWGSSLTGPLIDCEYLGHVASSARGPRRRKETSRLHAAT